MKEEETVRGAEFCVNDYYDLDDPAFGPKYFNVDKCSVCNNSKCYGHVGFLKLPIYVYNPIFLPNIKKDLRRLCYKCYNLNEEQKRCSKCKSLLHDISFVEEDGVNVVKDNIRYISYDKAKEILELTNNSLSNAIFKNVRVLPRMLRLNSEEEQKETHLSSLYRKFLEKASNEKVKRKDLRESFCKLVSSKGSDKGSTLISSIKGKDGLFRSLMAGKRVDNCGRAVITGMDELEVDEIGLPQEMCDKIRVLCKVDLKNIDKIIKYAKRDLITNAKNKRVKFFNIREGDVLYRPLRNNDIVMFNRQPSLWKYSLMCVRVRVLKDSNSCISMNTSLTTPYGADFDGDEMNVFYQDPTPEIKDEQQKMCVKNNILHDDEEPLISPIQDTVTTLFKISSCPTKVSKDMFYDCCMECNNYDIGNNKDFNTLMLISLAYPKVYKYDNSVLNKNTILTHIKDIEALEKGLSLTFIHNLQKIAHKYNTTVGGTSTSIRDLQTSNTHNNSILDMINSGSKGNMTNFKQMSESLGQQYVNNIPIEGGNCNSSYLKGLSPKEYLFHQMGGREGIISTNIYVANIGYTSRRVCKAMSGVMSDGHNVYDGKTFIRYVR